MEKLSGKIVTGLSYAYGAYNAEIMQAIDLLGIEYSRTVDDTGRFSIPSNFLEWNPTCHFKRAISDEKLVDAFLNPPSWRKPELFYIWGHRYKMEQMQTWLQMEQLCETLAGKDDVWYTTNLEYCRYAKAVNSWCGMLKWSRCPIRPIRRFGWKRMAKYRKSPNAPKTGKKAQT